MEMNKTEFLDELKNGLAVLEEKEQQDILEEYTQHIDMKMERGLSEEEAIGDFGDPVSYTHLSRKLIAGLYMVGSQVRAIIRRTKRKLITRAAAGSIRAVCPAMTQPQYNPMMIPAMVMGLTPMYPSGNMVMPTPIATPGSTLCTPNMD